MNVTEFGNPQVMNFPHFFIRNGVSASYMTDLVNLLTLYLPLHIKEKAERIMYYNIRENMEADMELRKKAKRKDIHFKS